MDVSGLGKVPSEHPGLLRQVRPCLNIPLTLDRSSVFPSRTRLTYFRRNASRFTLTSHAIFAASAPPTSLPLPTTYLRRGLYPPLRMSYRIV